MITINDLNTETTLGKAELSAKNGGYWGSLWSYSPYSYDMYNYGYFGSSYTPSMFGYGLGSMGSWAWNQGINDAGHDAFIDYIRS